MPSNEFRYSIDTSALLDGYVRHYPPDIVPGLWNDKFDQLIESGHLFAAYDVLEDLEKKDDGAYKWAKKREKMFLEIHEYESELKTVMTEYPRLVDTRTGKSGSDPMVVALAMSKNLTVVSGEGVGSAKSPRIPFVCDQMDIRHINLLTLIRDQSWTFGNDAGER